VTDSEQTKNEAKTEIYQITLYVCNANSVDEQIAEDMNYSKN
jgi:hypothetical protein